MHEFKIVLVLEKGATWPVYSWQPEATEIESIVVNDYKKIVSYLITDCKNNIRLNYLNKGAHETIVSSAGKILHDQTIEIKEIYVDNILLDGQFLFNHSKYIPNYNTDFIKYCIENNILLTTEAHCATKFWHNGQWIFEFDYNFWPWYCAKGKNSIELSSSQISKYLGQSADQIQDHLNELKKHLI
jgi:hypothetical protein